MKYDESIEKIVKEIEKRNPDMQKNYLVKTIKSLPKLGNDLYFSMYGEKYDANKTKPLEEQTLVEQYTNSLMELIKVALERYQAALELNDLKAQNADPKKIKEQEEKCHNFAKNMEESEDQVKKYEDKLRDAKLDDVNKNAKAKGLKEKMFKIKDKVLSNLDIKKLNEKKEDKKEYSFEEIMNMLKEKYPDGKIPKDAIDQIMDPNANLDKKEKESRILDKLRSGDYAKGAKSKVQKVYNFSKKHYKGILLAVALGGMLISIPIYGTPLAVPARILSALWHPLHHLGMGNMLHGFSKALIGTKSILNPVVGTYNRVTGSWMLGDKLFNTYGVVDWLINAAGAGLLAKGAYGLYKKIKNRFKKKDYTEFLKEYREKVHNMTDEELEAELNRVGELLANVTLGKAPRDIEPPVEILEQMLKICEDEMKRRKEKAETKDPLNLDSLSLEQLQELEKWLSGCIEFGAYPAIKMIGGIEIKVSNREECEKLLAQVKELIANKTKSDKQEKNNIESLTEEQLQELEGWLTQCFNYGAYSAIKIIGGVEIKISNREECEKLLMQVREQLQKLKGNKTKTEESPKLDLNTLSDKELIDKYLEAKAKAATDTQAQALINDCVNEFNNRKTKLASEIKNLSGAEIKTRYQELKDLSATDEVIKEFVDSQLTSLKEEIKQRTKSKDWIKNVTPEQAQEFINWGNTIFSSMPQSLDEMYELNGELLYFDDLNELRDLGAIMVTKSSEDTYEQAYKKLNDFMWEFRNNKDAKVEVTVNGVTYVYDQNNIDKLNDMLYYLDSQINQSKGMGGR